VQNKGKIDQIDIKNSRSVKDFSSDLCLSWFGGAKTGLFVIKDCVPAFAFRGYPDTGIRRWMKVFEAHFWR
jgi:hypothetical protein